MIPPLLFMGYMLYGIPLLLLYILIVTQLIKKSNQKYFSSSFFTLAKIQAFIDITGYINFTFEFRSPLCPLLGYLFANMKPSFFLSFSYFYRYYAQYVHNMLIAFASVNRLTALLYPSKHEKLWSKGVWYCVGFSFVLAFGISWYFLFSTILVIEFTPGQIGYYVFIYNKPPIKISSAHVELSVLAIAGSVTVISNVASLIVLIRQNLKRLSNTKNVTEMKRYFRKAELGLFAVAVGDFAVMGISCIIIVNLIILMIDNDYNNPLFDFYYLQLAWVTDLGFLSRPVLLMLMSKNVRKVVVHSLLCSEEEEFRVKTMTATRSHISRVSVRSKQVQVY